MLESKANWSFINDESSSVFEELNELELSSVTKELLMQRNITTKENATKFIAPQLDYLNNPAALSMIDNAADRVHKAINNEEKILIYGDYDADGVSSTALLLKTLIELNAQCDFYIPNRFTEGYGLNEGALRHAHENGFTVVITVDTGIASVHEAAIAKELGIDLIITDHHEIQDDLPAAFAIINPKSSPDYPFKDLAGVGVALKFAEQMLGYFPEHLLDLVAIGTIADLVPLINENRILAYYGLQKLTTTENVGLKALKKRCTIEGNVTEEDVGFVIGPRINAVGRLQDAELAVQLLMTEDEQEAEEIAEIIEKINENRQQIVSKIVDEAKQMITHKEADKNVIIIAKEGWNEGVLGIVASQLVRTYNRPSIVLSINEETQEIKGSARSIPAFNLFENCMEIKGLFIKFGGHSQAAGMTFTKDNFTKIQNKLNDLIEEQLTLNDFKQEININKKIPISSINENLIDEINLLAPFGMENPKPVFKIEHIPSNIRHIGHMKKHLKLELSDETTLLEVIGFNMGNLYNYITPHTSISVVGDLGINEWNGNRKLQIVMQDMKIKDWQLFDHRGRKNIDIMPYLMKDKQSLLISDQPLKDTDPISEYVQQITYSVDIETLEEVDELFLFDLPNNLSELQRIIKVVKPINIHACYYVEDSTYLTSFTSREAFKWFYTLIFTRKKLDLKIELNKILNAKKWTKERVVFMAKVFSELDFIKINNGVIELNLNSEKKDLQESTMYQEQLNQAEIEKTLYYSNYKELRKWFEDYMTSSKIAEEELTHGL